MLGDSDFTGDHLMRSVQTAESWMNTLREQTDRDFVHRTYKATLQNIRLSPFPDDRGAGIH